MITVIEVHDMAQVQVRFIRSNQIIRYKRNIFKQMTISILTLVLFYDCLIKKQAQSTWLHEGLKSKET